MAKLGGLGGNAIQARKRPHSGEGRDLVGSPKVDRLETRRLANGLGIVRFSGAPEFKRFREWQDSEGGRSRKIAIWGASVLGKSMLGRLRDNSIEVSLLIDRNPDLHGSKVGGLEVCSPKELIRRRNGGEEFFILIGTMFVDSVCQDLSQMGFAEGIDFEIPNSLEGTVIALPFLLGDDGRVVGFDSEIEPLLAQSSVR